MEKTSPTVNAAIVSHLGVMEHFLNDMIYNVNEAQRFMAFGCSVEDAIGTLIDSEPAFAKIKSLYDAMMTIYDNAFLLEHPEE